MAKPKQQSQNQQSKTISKTPMITSTTLAIADKKQLAEILDVSLSTIERWIKQGMPYVKRGGFGEQWQFNVAAVKAWRYRQQKS